MSTDPPPRFVSPSPESEFYWRSGEDGQLRLQHCNSCDRFIHPAGPVCPYCHSRDLAPKAVSGRGTIATFTINHKEWIPGFTPPYVFAFVEIEEDPTIRLGANIVGCDVNDVSIGMAVDVEFEANGEWFVPLFHPRD